MLALEKCTWTFKFTFGFRDCRSHLALSMLPQVSPLTLKVFPGILGELGLTKEVVQSLAC